MNRPVFDHPAGHRRYYSERGHPSIAYRADQRDPANWWQCRCGVLSRSWEAADNHTREEHQR